MPDRNTLESPLETADRSILGVGDGRPAGVVFEERKFHGYFNIRLDTQDNAALSAVQTAVGVILPLVPNTVSSSRTNSVFWLGPDEWLVVCDPDQHAAMGAGLSSALEELHSAVNDTSGGQTLIRLSGARALDTLSKGCTLDLHPRAFAPGMCAQTQIAKTAAVIRPCPSNQPCFDIIVRRSFADYLWHWLRNAASEYGARVAALPSSDRAAPAA